jgi:type IV conjugative transfer system protein TraL
MSKARHVILSHLDSPVKVLFWTKGELMLILGPFFVGVCLDLFALGIVFSGINYWAINQYKKRFGKGQLQAVMYWYLPSTKKLKGLPVSYIREFL